MVLLCAMALAGPSISAAQSQLPDLVSIPPYDIRIKAADEGDGKALRFSTSVANRSDFGFDLIGIPEDAETSIANQCVAWAAPRVCSERAEVGSFEWHPEHSHFHLLDFELYELRKLTSSGAPDMSKGGLVSSGGKISFCLLDYEPDGPARHPLYAIGNPVYYACEASTQGISPGWRDTYTWGLYGQQILVEGVPDGTYAVVVTVDPDKRLLETTRKNDVSATRIMLKNQGSRASAICYYIGVSSRCIYDD